ncbi:MAG: sulfotransferase family 2 domain-containing protein [Pseudomonadota bacterium]|nr:sulfotransferase family 2 domain-containing protein [Pseudomonadota bacterium]
MILIKRPILCEFRRVIHPGDSTSVHFLHIGKSGGTAIKRRLRDVNRDARRIAVIAHQHKISLADLPRNAPYFFSVREPVSRFRSAFYSRKRKGQPTAFRDWSPVEAVTFDRFPHANDLAESLFEDGDTGRAAFIAMKSMVHVRKHQHMWFPDRSIPLDTRPPICVLRQEHLDDDFEDLKRLLRLPAEMKLDKDPAKAHRNDYRQATPLSDKAVANLKAWYAIDVQFYKLVDAWVREHQKTAS